MRDRDGGRPLPGWRLRSRRAALILACVAAAATLAGLLLVGLGAAGLRETCSGGSETFYRDAAGELRGIVTQPTCSHGGPVLAIAGALLVLVGVPVAAVGARRAHLPAADERNVRSPRPRE